MKKLVKRLSLGKKTITNLERTEMSQHIGGGPTNGNACTPTNNCLTMHKKCWSTW